MTMHAGGLTAEHLGLDVSIPLDRRTVSGTLLSIEHGFLERKSGDVFVRTVLESSSRFEMVLLQPGQAVCL